MIKERLSSTTLRRIPTQPPSTGVTFLFIFLVVFAVFSGCLENEFVHWDDPQMVRDNPMIKSLDSKHLWDMVTTFHMSSWMPLTWLTHAVDYRLFHLDFYGHHFGNIVLHGLNSFLVFLLFMEFTAGRGWRSRGSVPVWAGGMFAALLFGLHPLRVESVAWISERKDVLSVFFILLTYLMYLRYGLEDNSRKRSLWYVLALGSFVLAIFSKPMALTVPLVLILFDVFPLGRIPARETMRSLIAEKIPFFIISAFSVVMTLMALKSFNAMVSVKVLSMTDRLMNAFRSLSIYLWKTLLPTGLVPLYPFPKDFGLLSAWFLGSVALFIFICWFCWRKWLSGERFWTVAWVYYLVTVSPVLGILQVGNQSAADRYTHLTTLGLYMIAGAGLVLAGERIQQIPSGRYLEKIFLTCCFLILVCLGLQAQSQIRVWKNSFTLWSNVAGVYPNRMAKVHNNLGSVYLEQNRYDEAIREFQLALKLKPSYLQALTNMALMDIKQGRLKEAQRKLEAILKKHPRNLVVNLHLGAVHFKEERYADAEEQYRTALKIRPSHPLALYNLGSIQLKQNRFKEASINLQSAVDENPDHMGARYNLGIALLSLGKRKEAEKELKEVLRRATEYKTGVSFEEYMGAID